MILERLLIRFFAPALFACLQYPGSGSLTEKMGRFLSPASNLDSRVRGNDD